jgi:hypothetical protein
MLPKHLIIDYPFPQITTNLGQNRVFLFIVYDSAKEFCSQEVSFGAVYTLSCHNMVLFESLKF